VNLDYVRSEAQAGNMHDVLVSMVAEGKKVRLHLPADTEHIRIASCTQPKWMPEELVTTPSHDVDRLPMYGMFRWGDAFTPRQLITITTFIDLVNEVRDRIIIDAINAGMMKDDKRLNDGGTGALAYADSVATYLAEAVSKLTTFHTNSLIGVQKKTNLLLALVDKL
jgi:putative DNA methylase